MGGPVPARLRHHKGGTGRRDGLVLRVLQPPPPAQRRRRPVTDQLRDRRAQPRRGIGSPPRSRGNHIPPLGSCRGVGVGRPPRHTTCRKGTAVSKTSRKRTAAPGSEPVVPPLEAVTVALTSHPSRPSSGSGSA